MARILAIDDDPDILVTLNLCLATQGHTVKTLEENATFLKVIHEFKPNLVILDVMMPGMTGGTIYSAIRSEIGPHLPVIISSGSKVALRAAQNDPLLAHSPKPVDLRHLIATVNELLTLAAAQ